MDLNQELPMTRQDLLPKGRRDRSLFVLMIVMIPLMTFWEFFVVVPNYHSSLNLILCTHIILGTFIVINICGNMYLLIKVGTSVKDVTLPAVLLPGWRYCHICQSNAPPRSYHCSMCDECILKQDHHCMFAGRCVGYFNHRYFFYGLLYICVGSCYSLIYQLEYTFMHMGGLRPSLLIFQLAPHFGWLFGSFNWFGFVCATLNLFLVLVIAMTFYLFFIQARGIYYNQTIYERKHATSKYNLGWKNNIQEVLGTAWHIAWLWPWISSPLKGDGIQFLEGLEVENTKHI